MLAMMGIVASQGGLDPNIKLLMHFDGDFINEVNKETQVVYASTVKLTTVSSAIKFGTGAADIPATSGLGLLSTASLTRDAIDLSNDFTCEFWVKSTTYRLVNLFQSEIGYLIQWNPGSFTVGKQPYTVVPTSVVLNDDIYHHVAYVNVSNTLNIYIDGVLRHSIPDVGDGYGAGSSVEIFKLYGVGVVDEFLISNNVRYTANFTPPNNQY